MSSSYRNSLNDWLAQLDVEADVVLDIGGSQETMPKRVKSWKVEEYIIADLPNPHKDSPKPDVEIDLNIYANLTPMADIVFCLEVFDYVYDPATAFENIADVLKDGGIAWVSFPSVYPLHQPVEDDALRYMESGIVKLAHKAGMTVEAIIKRRPESNKWQEFIAAERMRAAKHEDHSFTGFIVKFKK